MEATPPAPDSAPSISSQHADPASTPHHPPATNDPSTVRWLGIYAVVASVILGVGLLVTWNALYRPSISTLVVVNPPLVTLDSSKDDRYSFTAIVLPAAVTLGNTSNAVTWSVDGGGEIDSQGVFRLKPSPGPVSTSIKVTARLASNPSRSGTAMVHLLPGRHLEILPQGISVFPSQQVPFRTPNADVTWSTASPAGSVSKDGLFTATSTIDRPAIVQVTARGKSAEEIAAAAVIVTSPFAVADSQSWLGMLFVILCGSLGSMIYYAASFVNFVGNRTFRSSWFWFYLSRPFVGGALALVFYFVVGSGILPGSAVTDLMKVGLVSSLVGLFSDKAVNKLSDILDVLLATKDERKDKLRDTPSPKEPTSTPGKSTEEEPSKPVGKAARA